MDATCWVLLRRMRDVTVDAIEPMVPTEVSDSFDPARERRTLREDGDSDTLASGTNTP